MSTFNGTPIPLGSVQTSYSDQMATAFAGQLVSESDINLTDSVLVAEANGIVCGFGVVASVNDSAIRSGVNDTTVALPTSANVAADFAGVIVRPKSAFSMVANDARIRANFGAMILSASRVGGRIWDTCYKGAATGGAVYWRVGNAVSADATPVGALCGQAITGAYAGAHAAGTLTFNANPADGDTVTINCGSSQVYRFKNTPASANDIKLEATLSATLAHFVLALDLSGTAGVDYFAGTAGIVNAGATLTGSVITLTALVVGTAANAYTLAVSNASATTGITKSAATLLGGVAASVQTDTVELTAAKWLSAAADGALAKLQLG